MTGREELLSLLRECEQLITERLHGPGVDDLTARVRAVLPRYVVEQGETTYRVVDTLTDHVVDERHHAYEAHVQAAELNEQAGAGS